MILGAAVFGALSLFGLVLGILDYRWAPENNKLAPRCQKPEGWGDFLLAIIGFPLKFLFVCVVIEPIMGSIADDAVSFVLHLMLLGFVGGFMATLCLPVTLWYTPTINAREEGDQCKQEGLCLQQLRQVHEVHVAGSM